MFQTVDKIGSKTKLISVPPLFFGHAVKLLRFSVVALFVFCHRFCSVSVKTFLPVSNSETIHKTDIIHSDFHVPSLVDCYALFSLNICGLRSVKSFCIIAHLIVFALNDIEIEF